MNNLQRHGEDQEREIQQLRAQLADAQETLRAIREGEVDSLVVSTPAGPRIFTLQEADHTYQTIVEQMQEGAVTMVEDGHINYCNQRFAEMVKRPLERIIGSHFCEHLVETDRLSAQNLLRQSPQEPVRGELTLQAADGSQLPIHVALGVVAHGEMLSISMVVTDLSERERVERLLASEQLVRAILNQAADGVIVCDTEGRLTFTNPAARRIAQLDTARSPVTTVGHLWRNVLDGQGRPIPVEAQSLLRALAGHVSKAREKRVIRDDGSHYDILVSASPLADADGRIIGAVATFTDITQRKRAEEALRTSEERLRLAQAAAGLGIHDFHIPSGGITWDTRVRELWGIGLDEPITYDTFTSGLHPEDLAATQAAVDRALDPAGTGTYFAEFRVISRADGVTRWVAATGQAIFKDGSAVRLIGTVLDISSRKHTEQAINSAKAAAEAANAAKSQFLANMSHELRTPMNAILGMTDLALREQLSPAAMDYLRTVKDSGESLLDLLNTLLDFSRIEAGQMELDSCPFQLRATVTQVAKMLAVRAAEKDLELICDIQDDVPDGVVGDPLRLRQVLMNLVGNAVKFTAEGEVAITAAVEARGTEDVRLRFEVRDTGPGIASEDQRRIFSPFTQADASTTRRHGGSGLGLAIVQDLVGRMDGKVELHSELGQGSTFTFTTRLGLQSEPESTPTTALLQHKTLEGLPVLLVVGNATSRQMLQRTLSAWGMDPTTVDNVPTALTRMQEAVSRGRRFGMVLADVNLLDIDGFLLAERVGEDPRLAGPVILMLSAAQRMSQIERCCQLGAVYVEKPISPTDLLHSIVRALGIEHSSGHEAAPVTRTPPSRTLRILLAEDNRANQKLAIHLLVDRGHQVTVAENGQQAIDLLREEPYDVVLMDVQMPVMDGFTATAAMRAMEEPYKANIRIIAMTAHALREDAQRCISAGMDAYISKPIDADELIELVERSCDADAEPKQSGTASYDAVEQADRAPRAAVTDQCDNRLAPDDQLVFDPSEAVRRCFGSMEMLEQMVTYFFDEADVAVTDTLASLRNGDAESLHRAAHRLKGTLIYLGANRAQAAVQHVEDVGRSRDLAPAPAALKRLTTELQRLKQALQAYRDHHG